MNASRLTMPGRPIATVLSLILVLTGALAINVVPVFAATTCTFATSGSTMKLNADCTTDTAIVIPNGFTLEGRNHTITGIDTPADHFRGAVVGNGGAVANVKNLRVMVSALADVCDAGDDRLRGILFEGASGKIERTIVHEINQGASGCQEGNAIEVRNAAFDGTHPATLNVRIQRNVVSNYQKTGIIANGDVSARVSDNDLTGLGPVNYIAQNGIQIGFGALGRVTGNVVSANVYTPQTFASGGILLVAAGTGILVQENKVSTSDVGIWLNGANNGRVKDNLVQQSTFDGIALDDSFGAVSGNRVDKNRSLGNDIGIGLYGAGVTGNTIDNNRTTGNVTNGILVASGATGNSINRTTATGNGVLDISNTGANTYSRNTCNTSSGPPVDCP